MGRNPFQISLRIKHPSVDPELVASRLGRTPKSSWRAGAQRVSPREKQLGIADHSYCAFALDTSETSLADALASQAKAMAPYKKFFSELTDSGGSVEFYVGWFIEHHTGDIFEASLLRDLGSLEIDLTIEVYGPDEKSFDPVILDFGKQGQSRGR
jgi:hypothetical protein